RTSFTWGIPVSFDPKHVTYVWLDALTNYITGIGYDCDGNHGEMFNKNWPADLHLIGKDIIRFHTIYWPIFLMALDLPLPKQIFGHPWLLQGDGKMSKSKGNVLYADELAEMFGVDAVRYFVLHEMPFENDGTITYELMVERMNSDLANTLGNLVNRTISMSNKYFGGVVNNSGVEEEVDADLKAVVCATADKVTAKMDQLRVADALTEIFSLFKRCNKYIDETMPWALAKEEEKLPRLETVLYNLIEGISIGASLLESFMPSTAKRIAEQINGSLRSLEECKTFGLYPSGNKVVEKPEILFARLDVKEILAAVEAKKAAQGPVLPKYEGVAELINIDDFGKVDLRVAQIKAAEPIKKAKKLLKIQLDDGFEGGRQVVSGIAPWYKPEDLVGKKIVVVANLKPAKLCGVESNGMIIAADCDENTVKVLFVDESIPNGAKLR
ncbi:MAG: methionine--tRNA ligase subunit beta, partial [Ruminococcaceae bacterium]|nr:methionine--tRNA ligase subunit beta [Oscillospiraceae bacterium]